MKNITDNENFDTFSYEWYDNTTPDPSNGLTPYHNMQRIVDICHKFVDNFDKEAANILFLAAQAQAKLFFPTALQESF